MKRLLYILLFIPLFGIGQDFLSQGDTTFLTTPMELPTTNLIGHWKFSSKYYDAATQTFDNLASAATTYDGVSRNVPNWAENQYGWGNSAMAFDGVDDVTGDMVDIGLISNNLITWSVGFWIDDYVEGIIDFLLGNGGSSVVLDYSNQVAFRETDSDYHAFFQNSLIETAGYHLVVLVANGTTIVSYLDGDYVSTITPTATTFLFNNIGSGYATESYKPQCTLSEVFFYDRAITAEEVKNAYNGVDFIETP